MQKETETEETIGFVVIIFIIGGILIGGGVTHLIGYAYAYDYLHWSRNALQPTPISYYLPI